MRRKQRTKENGSLYCVIVPKTLWKVRLTIVCARSVGINDRSLMLADPNSIDVITSDLAIE
jgi:hypothetical protein